MAIKTLIIEDEAAAARRLEKMVLSADPEFVVAGILDSVSSTLRWLDENPEPDLIFLDINLGDGLSFEIFNHKTLECPVIFTTAYDEYAIKAFKHNGIDYILKPVKEDELKESIRKFKEKRFGGQMAMRDSLSEILQKVKTSEGKWKKRFVVNFGERIKAIETDDIAYFYIMEKNTFMVTIENDSYGISYSLEQLEELLDPDKFYRINRKYLIRFESIKNMWAYSRSRVKLELIPPTADEVIVSTDRSSGFKDWLNK